MNTNITILISRLEFNAYDLVRKDGNYVFECKLCRLSFPKFAEFKFHKHAKIPKITQPVKITKPKPLPRKTIKTKQEPIQQPCSASSADFDSVKQLKTHPEKQQRPPLNCPYCDKQYSVDWSLKHHVMTVHEIQKSYVCAICDYSSTDKHILECHIITQHTKDYPYDCDICGRGFLKKYLLVAHMEAIHEEAKFICEACGKVCNSRHALHKHQKTHKSENEKKGSVCEVCGKIFLYLRDHKKMHIEPSIMCESCGKTFSCKAYLHKHILKEHTIKPFKCEMCDKEFVKKEELANHTKNKHFKQKTDGKERQYQCDLCGRLYLSKSGLRTHLDQHAKRKVFPCRRCEEKFETSTLRIKHKCKILPYDFQKESISTDNVSEAETSVSE